MQLQPPEQHKWSSIYHGVYAKQKMGARLSLDVFSSIIPLESLKLNKEVKLLRDITDRAEWAMHQLVQRNINQARAEKIRSQFLEQGRRVKFFPSITVALLPISQDMPRNAYERGNEPDGFNGIKGLSITHGDPSRNLNLNDFARLKWDQSILQAIVVDGQHRVEAIRQFIRNKGEAQIGSDTIPVTFVIFPTVNEQNDEFAVLEATRQIFIDINNTPENVSEQRLVSIDDRNILRRITASTLGVQVMVDDTQDVYQRILGRDHFEPADFELFLNKYIVGEDVNDDVSVGRQRNHATLLPWEVTHIMTVHELLIKDILLARDGDIGLGADLNRLCQIIDSNLADQYERIQDEDDSDTIIEMLRQNQQERLGNAAIGLFAKMIKARVESNQQFASIDKNDEESRDQLREIQDAYRREMREGYLFYFDQSEASALMTDHFSRVSSLVWTIFNNLWFVRELREILTQGKVVGDQELSPQLIKRLVCETKMNAQALDDHQRPGRERARSAIDIMFSENFPDRDRLRGPLLRLLDDLDTKAKTNTLRFVVGQQALFLYFRQIHSDGLITEQEAKVELEFINRLGEHKFFDSGTRLKLTIFCQDIQVAPLSGTLLKVDNQMNPGLDHAKRAASLLSCVRYNVYQRDHIDNNPNIPRSLTKHEHTRLITALGQSAYKKLEQGGHLEQVGEFIEWAAEQPLDPWLTRGDITALCNQDADEMEQRTRLQKAKKVIGGVILRSIVEKYYQAAEE